MFLQTPLGSGQGLASEVSLIEIDDTIILMSHLGQLVLHLIESSLQLVRSHVLQPLLVAHGPLLDLMLSVDLLQQSVVHVRTWKSLLERLAPILQRQHSPLSKSSSIRQPLYILGL